MGDEVQALTKAQVLGGLLVCAFSFFVSTVLEEMRPIQMIYLLSHKGWTVVEASLVGLVEEVAVIVTSPLVGHFFDHVTKHHVVLGLSIFIMSLANMTIVFSDNFWLLQARGLVLGITQATIRPGTASLTMSIIGHHHFHRWVSHSQVAAFAGKVCSLIIACFVVNSLYPDVESLFIIFGVFGIVGVVCIGFVDLDEEEDGEAPDADDEVDAQPAAAGQVPQTGTGGAEAGAVRRDVHAQPHKRWHARVRVLVPRRATPKVSLCALFRDPHLVTWFGCIFFFFFGKCLQINTLIGQVLVHQSGLSFMIWAFVIICIGVALAMPLSGFIKELTECFSWKKVLLGGWALLLLQLTGIQLVKYLLDSNTIGLASTQLFSGISSAVNSNAIMVVTHVLTHGSGRFGLAQGCVNMALHGGFFAGSLSSSLLADRPMVITVQPFVVALLPLLGLAGLRLRSPHPHEGPREVSVDSTPNSTPDSTLDSSPHSVADGPEQQP